MRTKIYRCVSEYSGHFFPIFSQGFRICISMPCNDEPRLKVEPGNIIHVTRFRKQWLFGERRAIVRDNSTNRVLQNSERGWFPSHCAIDISSDRTSSSTNNDNDSWSEEDEIRKSQLTDNVEQNQNYVKTLRLRNMKLNQHSSSEANGYH